MRSDAGPEFVYDALKKRAVARGTSRDGSTWKLEFLDRRDDDSMEVVVHEPGGGSRTLVLTEDDFVFSDSSVALRRVPGTELRMEPLYLRKLRGFTRGNIPTPDIPGPSLP